MHRSVASKWLYVFVVLAMIVGFVPHSAPVAQAAPEPSSSEALPQAAPPDPMAQVSALLGDDPQSQALNAVLGELPSMDHSLPDRIQAPRLELPSPQSAVPEVAPPLPITVHPAFPDPHYSVKNWASDLQSTIAKAKDDSLLLDEETDQVFPNALSIAEGAAVYQNRITLTSLSPNHAATDRDNSKPTEAITPTQTSTIFLPSVLKSSGSLNGGVVISASEGGTIASPDEKLSMIFHPDGLPRSIVAATQEDGTTTLPANLVLMGPKVTVQAQWLDNNQPVNELDPEAQPTLEPGAKPIPPQPQYWATVSVRLMAGQEENDMLAIARLAHDGGKWEILPTQLDLEAGVALAETDHLGAFALVENAALWQGKGQLMAEPGDEFIVDDGDPGFAVYEYDGTVDYFWPSFCGPGGCWDGDALWTYNRSDYEPLPLDQPWNWAKWTPSLPEAGYYYVETWIPAADATTTGAEYEIHHAGQVNTVTVNQLVISGAWKQLGAFYFAADGSEFVYLDDVVPETWQLGSQIGYDGMKFIYAGDEPPPPVDLEPPVIHSVDRWLDGSGSTVIRAHVTDNVAVDQVVLIFNGVSVDMNPIGGDLYEAIVPVPPNQISSFQVVAVDTSGNVATFPPGSQIDIRGYLSRNVGWHNFACGGHPCDPGMMGTEADPVNTVNGNFAYHTTDLTVAGIGDTDIVLERGYNSLPNEPQGMIRYTWDGASLVEEPLDVHPEPFGPGWTFPFATSLLVMDNALLQGVQARYADGHTANFTDNGDGTFTPVETRVYDTLTTEGSGYLLKTKDLISYHFDAEGHLTSITDRNSNSIILTYDGDLVVRADNSAGRWVTFEYNGDGLVSDIYAPENLHLHYEYQDGLLHSFTNGRGKTTVYEYDAEGRLTDIVTPKGHPSLRLTYDGDLGRVTEQIVGAAERHTFVYDDANRTTTITDAYDNQTTHVYDEKYRLVESRNALGQSEHYDYNERDNRTYFRDRAGNEWFYTYDDNGNRLTQDGPLGWHSEFGYNDLNLVTRFAEKVDAATTRETTYAYDENGNLTEACNPYDCSTIAYDGRGLPTDLWDSAHNHTVNTYDAEGDLVAVTNAENETTEYDHDDLGRMTDMWTPLGYHYSYGYDPNNNLVTVDGPLGYHLGYGYDDNDNLAVEIDPNGGETEYAYDASENLVSVKNQIDVTTVAYTYGDMNEMTSFTDGEERTWTYDYDEVQRLTDIHGPLSTDTHFEYDAVGNVTDVADPEGHVTHTEYDDLYRPESVTLNYVAGGPENADTNVTTEYEYDLVGNILRLVDAEGNATEYAYDLLDRMTLKRSAEGQEWEYEYDPMGNVTRVINPRDYETAFVYDKAYRLYQTIDALGHITTFVYDDDGNLGDEIDPLGVVTHYDYDELDRPIREVRNYQSGQPEDAQTNVTTEYQYDPAGNLRFSTDPRDYVSEFRYDPAQRLVDSYDYEGGHTHFTYDRVDNLLTTTDDNNHTTTYTYDDLDRRKTVTNAEGHTVEFSYDKVGNLTDILDARSNPTHFDVDALGRTVRMEDALEGKWFYEYDRVGNVLVETDANSHDTTYTYDDVYRLRTATDAEGYVSQFVYDANDNLVEFIDGNSHSTTYTYDELDRLGTTTNAEDETTEYGYDPLGNQTYLIEADGTVTRYGYDPLYRLNAVTENYVEGGPVDNDTNVLTRYTYDASSNLHEIINANGAVTTFDYDGMGRQVQEVDPLGNTWEYTYDGVGNRLTRLDANGDLTEYTYYPDDQLRRIDYHKDGTFVEYTYDENNNRTTMLDSLGTTTWAYDALNRVTDVVDPFSRALHFGYDPVGNRTEMVYPDGNPVAYTYYDNDWLKTMADPTARITSYERDGVGNLTRILYPNSMVTTITYDRADRVLTLLNKQTTGAKKTNSAFAYTYNEVGHVTQIVNEYGWRNPPVVTETYTYDGLHRLAGMENSDGVVMSYAYDKVGNRLAWQANDDLTTQTPFDGFAAGYDYNAANQLITATIDSEMPNGDVIIAFAYDGNGNRINKLADSGNGPEYGTDYTYDPENRLLVAQDYQLVDHGNRVDRAISTLEYDGGGRRLVKTYDPKTGGGGQKRVEYVFDGLDPVAEYSMLNGQRDNYYRGAMGRITTMHHFQSGSQGQMYWYHYNFKGDVVGLTKHHGQSTHNYRYDPYGGVVPAHGNFTDPHNHYTLTGKEFDEHTGLVYFGARHYDPSVGLWVTQDVYRGRLPRPMSLYRYGYVSNNPTSQHDLYGFSEDLNAELEENLHKAHKSWKKYEELKEKIDHIPNWKKWWYWFTGELDTLNAERNIAYTMWQFYRKEAEKTRYQIAMADPCEGIFEIEGDQVNAIKLPTCDPTPQTPSQPQSTVLAPANPENYAQCALYAQARRPNLGSAGGDGGAANYINRPGAFQIPNADIDLTTKIAVGNAIIWPREHPDTTGTAGFTYGHIAIVEQVEKDRIKVSQANWGTKYEMWISLDKLKTLYVLP